MTYQTGILEAVQDWGFRLGYNGPMGVLPYAGWQTRGSSIFDPQGSVNHHTAGSPYGLLPSLNTLLYGRPDVAGPLCNAALARNACLHLLAAGRSNNAGKGSWKGVTGNSRVWGLEVEHIGFSSEVVGVARWEAMWRWHRACADFSGFGIDMICQHFEWAPTRKIDFVKTITDPNVFRRRVGEIVKPVQPAPIEEEIPEMFLYSTEGQPVFFCDGGVSVGINENSDMKTFLDQKVKHFKLDDDTFKKFRQRFPGA